TPPGSGRAAHEPLIKSQGRDLVGDAVPQLPAKSERTSLLLDAGAKGLGLHVQQLRRLGYGNVQGKFFNESTDFLLSGKKFPFCSFCHDGSSFVMECWWIRCPKYSIYLKKLPNRNQAH